MNEELKEWLGVKPADLIVYSAGGAVAWMYFNRQLTIDILLSGIAVILCVVSCFMGMPADRRLSKIANFIKRVAYPGCLIATLICVYLNFTRWNSE